jgi:hypothetical protein
MAEGRRHSTQELWERHSDQNTMRLLGMWRKEKYTAQKSREDEKSGARSRWASFHRIEHNSDKGRLQDRPLLTDVDWP